MSEPLNDEQFATFLSDWAFAAQFGNYHQAQKSLGYVGEPDGMCYRCIVGVMWDVAGRYFPEAGWTPLHSLPDESSKWGELLGQWQATEDLSTVLDTDAIVSTVADHIPQQYQDAFLAFCYSLVSQNDRGVPLATLGNEITGFLMGAGLTSLVRTPES